VRPLIRAATAGDIPALLEIERQSFSHQHWQGKDFLAAECMVAEVDGHIVGFLVSREVFCGSREDLGEREILNLAVTPLFRRMGIAKALLRREIQRKAVFFLEVRESNQAAQALYRTAGFTEIGRRPEYYQEPREGAIVMQMKRC
jgi:[ribosomal protein S18]-alanine N-acetyltransferase